MLTFDISSEGQEEEAASADAVRAANRTEGSRVRFEKDETEKPSTAYRPAGPASGSSRQSHDSQAGTDEQDVDPGSKRRATRDPDRECKPE